MTRILKNKADVLAMPPQEVGEAQEAELRTACILLGREVYWVNTATIAQLQEFVLGAIFNENTDPERRLMGTSTCHYLLANNDARSRVQSDAELPRGMHNLCISEDIHSKTDQTCMDPVTLMFPDHTHVRTREISSIMRRYAEFLWISDCQEVEAKVFYICGGSLENMEGEIHEVVPAGWYWEDSEADESVVGPFRSLRACLIGLLIYVGPDPTYKDRMNRLFPKEGEKS